MMELTQTQNTLLADRVMIKVIVRNLFGSRGSQVRTEAHEDGVRVILLPRPTTTRVSEKFETLVFLWFTQ